MSEDAKQRLISKEERWRTDIQYILQKVNCLAVIVEHDCIEIRTGLPAQILL